MCASLFGVPLAAVGHRLSLWKNRPCRSTSTLLAASGTGRNDVQRRWTANLWALVPPLAALILGYAIWLAVNVLLSASVPSVIARMLHIVR